MTRILRYVSDIHLELLDSIEKDYLRPLWNFTKENNCTSYYLALAGDISNSNDEKLPLFFEKVSEAYEKVFYIMGNHEYYDTLENRPYSECFKRIKNMSEKFSNIFILDNETIELDEFLIVGTTLWSSIPKHISHSLESTIRDYSSINYDENRKITVKDTNRLNSKAIDFLKTTIKINCDKNLIILSHHAPLFSDHKTGRYTADPIYDIFTNNNFAFHNNLSYMMKSPIKLWLYGHTHYASKFYFNDVLVATNQLGYVDEQSTINFSPEEYINLDLLSL